MRKILATVLAFVILMSMVVTVNAATFSKDNITTDVNGYVIRVTVKSDVDGRMTAHLYNEAKNTTLGVDYSSSPAENNGVYTYSFVFKVNSAVPTQKLYIRVGSNVPATEKEINYASINDKNAFFNRF